MNYAAFKDYLLRFLWRDGDPVLASDLDQLIKMGEARLNRDLRVDDMTRIKRASLEADSVAVPTDFAEMRSIYVEGVPTPLEYVTPHGLAEAWSRTKGSRFQPIYSYAGDALLFCGPMSPTSPLSVVMTYYAKVPDFQGTDASWLADNYLDLYTYACLRHTASYLRDDERVGLWKNEYDESLASVSASYTRKKYAGSPLKPSLPGSVL